MTGIDEIDLLIRDSDISVRALNCVKKIVDRYKIQNIKELSDLNLKKILKVRGTGIISAREIFNFILKIRDNPKSIKEIKIEKDKSKPMYCVFCNKKFQLYSSTHTCSSACASFKSRADEIEKACAEYGKSMQFFVRNFKRRY